MAPRLGGAIRSITCHAPDTVAPPAHSLPHRGVGMSLEAPEVGRHGGPADLAGRQDDGSRLFDSEAVQARQQVELGSAAPLTSRRSRHKNQSSSAWPW